MQTCFLTLPSPGDRTQARIVHKVRLLALRHLLTLPRAVRGVEGLARVLTELARRDPARLLSAVGAPDVLPLLLCSLSRACETELILERAVPSLLVRLGRLPEALLWDRPVQALTDGADTWCFEPPARGLCVDPGGVTVRLADGALVRLAELGPRRTTHPLSHGVHLATADTFPLAGLEAHPDKAGNALDLADRPIEAWIATLQAALHLIQRGLPAWSAQLPDVLSRLLPVGFEPRRHLSASYREAPGLAYLTLHPDPLVLAEAIVHEGQHSKLNAMSWLDPLLHNRATCWTASPVRPDLRPLSGVLLAVHAFVAVAALHQGLASGPDPIRAERLAPRRAAVLASNAAGLRILETQGEPTGSGRRLISELRALHDALVADAGPLPIAPLEGPGLG